MITLLWTLNLLAIHTLPYGNGVWLSSIFLGISFIILSVVLAIRMIRIINELKK